MTNVREKGQAVIVTLLFVVAGVLLGAMFLGFVSQNTIFTGRELLREKALHFGDAGINRSLWEIRQNANWSGVGETSLGDGSYEVSVTSISAAEKRVDATGYFPSKANARGKRKIRAIITTGAVTPSFHYGAQVGEGGVEFESNAEIQGSVYSNGNIIGANGAKISGDAWVAGGTQSMPEQEWTTSNADYEFGKQVGSEKRFDVAQSFIPSTSSVINKVSLYIKKVGSPPNLTVEINKDKNGSPSDKSGDVLASGVLPSSAVTGSYGWIDVTFSSSPSVTSGSTYWLLLDAGNDSANYWVWGSDTNNGYGNGLGKYSENWVNKPWNDAGRDFNFKIWMGGVLTKIKDAQVGGEIHANTIENVTTTSSKAFAQNIIGGSFGNDVRTYAMSNCTITGNAWYTTNDNCAISGGSTTPYAGEPDPAPLAFPISDANIQQWKDDALAGGTCVQPQCDANGDYHPTASSTVSIGPKKITRDMLLDNNQTVIITGTVWVVGNIDISNGGLIKCAASYGSQSCVIVTDGWIHIQNNGEFQGSGQSGSYLMLLTTLAGCNGGTQQSQCTHHNAGMDLHNNARGAIFYAEESMIYLHNGVTVTELVGNKIHLSQNAILIYEQGLVNASFSSGPAGGWKIKSGSWHIIE